MTGTYSNSNQAAMPWAKVASLLAADIPMLQQISGEDWRQLKADAQQQGVLAILARHIISVSASHVLPQFLLDECIRLVHRFSALDLLLEKELQAVLQRFDQAGIPYLLFKGAALAYTLYDTPYLRNRCDTDVLFPDRAAAEKAWEILSMRHYQRRQTTTGRYVGLQFSCSRELAPGVYYGWDCHSQLSDYLFFAQSFDFQELLQNAETLPGLSSHTRHPGPVDAVLIACIHRVANIPASRADRLIWLLDIYLLTQNFSDSRWQQLASDAAARQLAGSCLHGLLKTAEVFDYHLPQNIIDQLTTAAARERIRPYEKSKRWQFYLLNLKTLSSTREKLRLIREHLFPDRDYMLGKYSQNNSLLLPALHIRRWFSGLKRYF